MDTQIFNDMIENFITLMVLTNDDEELNKYQYVFSPNNNEKRFEFCIVRKVDKFPTSCNFLKLEKHGYDIVKCLIDIESNIVRVTTRVRPDMVKKNENSIINYVIKKPILPKDRIDKYKNAGVEAKNARLYSWGANHHCFIEHYFKISKRNLERLQIILNIFPTIISYKDDGRVKNR